MDKKTQNKVFEQWQNEMRKNNKGMTHSEARLWAGNLECEMCKNFNMEYAECTKFKKPRKIIALDGPNEYFHMKKNCEFFERFTDTTIETTLDSRFTV